MPGLGLESGLKPNETICFIGGLDASLGKRPRQK